MTFLVAGLGGVLLLVVSVDATVTTLAAGSGGGPVTSRLSRGLGKVMAALPGRAGRWLRPYAGVVVLLATVLTWVALLWAGWSLVFSSADGAVVDATTSLPADGPARVYYAGFVVFTLGVGDVIAGSGGWQVTTAAASFMGLFLVTLSITYLVSVVSAAVDRRSMARSISLSGESGVDIVLLHWDGDGVSSQLSSLTQSLETQVIQVTQQHLAYPVLHHFHASSPAAAAPRALAALDDALLLLSAGLEPAARPPDDVLVRLRRALEHYGQTVGGAGGGDAPTPPLPDLAPLRRAGLPVLGDDDFADAAEEHALRRRRLHGLVASQDWAWPTSSAPDRC